MSLNISGEKCAVCKAYLFPEDDTVYCPECGAPHHRECYNSVGHCGLKDFHGTDNQYQKPKQPEANKEEPIENETVFCSMCGEKYDKVEIACPKCDTPNISKMDGRVVTVDLTGGVPDDVDIGDGVTVKDAKRFVAVNTHRYMPKFAAFKNGKKLSWNWLAFFTPSGWLMSRKMYLLGGIIIALEIAFSLISIPLRLAYQMVEITDAKNYIEYYTAIFEEISHIGQTAIFSGIIAIALGIILSLFIAMFGDLIYKKRVINKIKEINSNSDDIEQDFRKKGGVSFIAALLGYFAVSYLPSIIAYTMGML